MKPLRNPQVPWLLTCLPTSANASGVTVLCERAEVHGDQPGPVLLKSLVDSELWQIAQMDEVLEYLATRSDNRTVVPPAYAHAVL